MSISLTRANVTIGGYNTEKHNLFAEGNGCGKCLQTSCLKAKNTAYIVERAKEFVEKNPELPLSVTNLNVCEGCR